MRNDDVGARAAAGGHRLALWLGLLVAGASWLGLVPRAGGRDEPAADYRVTRVRLRACPGHEAELVGGRIAGSLTGPTNDFETLVEIGPDAVAAAAAAGDGWIELPVPPDRVGAYRFLKYQARNGVRGDVAEIEFQAGDRKLTGAPFGTAGSGAPENEPSRAFDGDPATCFRGESTFQAYVGLDLGRESQAAMPTGSVAQGAYDGPQEVVLESDTPGALVIYRLEAQGRPTFDAEGQPTGETQRAEPGRPIRVGASAVLQAMATKPGLAPSAVAAFAYRIGGVDNDDAPEVAEFHVGNSLTDTVNPWMEPLAASAGKRIRFYRFTIPGAPTDWLWEHPGSGFGSSLYAQEFIARAPLTDLISQPFSGHSRSVDNEADYSGRFFDLARKSSPRLRLWLYVQWPPVDWTHDRWANGQATDRGQDITFAPPATTWQDAALNHVRYTELVRDAMNRARALEIEAGTCEPVRILPGGLALARLKTEMDAGRVPGLAGFEATVFAGPGDIHLARPGAYLIALVHHACLQGESPEGRVTAAGSNLTDEQARIFQRIAWETASPFVERRAHIQPR